MHPEALEEFSRLFKALAATDETGEVSQLFFDGASSSSIDDLPPTAVFASVMGGLVNVNPGMNAIFASADAKVLGSVPEGELRHVVYRLSMSVEGVDIRKVAVLTAKPYGESWRALLTAEMEGLLQQLGIGLEK